MNGIDDYDMMEKDLESSLRYARECLEWEAQQTLQDDRADFNSKVQAQSILLVSKEGYEWLKTSPQKKIRSNVKSGI